MTEEPGVQCLLQAIRVGEVTCEDRKDGAQLSLVRRERFVVEAFQVCPEEVLGRILRRGIPGLADGQPVHESGDLEQKGMSGERPLLQDLQQGCVLVGEIQLDRKSTRLNSSHSQISYAV